MVEVNNVNIISVNRGDSFSVSLLINAGTELEPIPYHLKDEDKLYVGVMTTGSTFENALIKKRFNKENMIGDNVIISFTPEDTVNLLPGKYYYQVKLLTSDDEVNTVIGKTPFIIID